MLPFTCSMRACGDVHGMLVHASEMHVRDGPTTAAPMEVAFFLWWCGSREVSFFLWWCSGAGDVSFFLWCGRTVEAVPVLCPTCPGDGLWCFFSFFRKLARSRLGSSPSKE